MMQNNLSFLNKNDPTSFENVPPLDDDSPISELHHGKWWSESWQIKCKDRKTKFTFH